MTPGWHQVSLDDGTDLEDGTDAPALRPGQHMRWMLGVGDAADLLPKLLAQVDAFWLDERHTHAEAAGWLSRLNRLAAPGATLSAQAASSEAVDALRSAHFEVQAPQIGTRRPGRAGAIRAHFVPRFVAPPAPGGPWPAAAPAHRHALVVGAGLAGCSATAALAREGWRVTLLDAASGPAQGASGNPGGLFHSIVHGEDGLHARAHRAAALATWARVREAVARGDLPGACHGLLRLDARMDEATARTLLERQPWLAEQALWLNRAQAQALCGLPVPSGGWHFLQAGWLAPRAYAEWLLAEAQVSNAVQTRWACQVARIRRDSANAMWQVLDDRGQTLAEAPSLVLANAWQAQGLLDTLPSEHACAPLPMSAVRGQITVLPPTSLARTPVSHALPRLPVAGGGYVLSLPDGSLLCGATTQHHDTHPSLRETDHRHNLRQAQRLGALPISDGMTPPDIDAAALDGRVGWRATTPDRLPLVGALPWHVDRLDGAGHLRREQVRMLPREREQQDGCTVGGLYVLSGLGSRGITWAALAGDLLAHWVTGSVCPVESELRDATDPARFLARQHRQ